MLLLSPVGLVVAGLAALAAWFAYKYDIGLDDVIKVVHRLNEALQNPLETLKKIMSYLGGGLREKVRSLFPESWRVPDGAKAPASFSETETGKKLRAWWSNLKVPDLMVSKDPKEFISGKSLAQSEANKQMALSVRTDTNVKLDAPGSIKLMLPNGQIVGSIPLSTSVDKGRTQIDSAASVPAVP